MKAFPVTWAFVSVGWPIKSATSFIPIPSLIFASGLLSGMDALAEGLDSSGRAVCLAQAPIVSTSTPTQALTVSRHITALISYRETCLLPRHHRRVRCVDAEKAPRLPVCSVDLADWAVPCRGLDAGIA